jgi:hypothetical protein
LPSSPEKYMMRKSVFLAASCAIISGIIFWVASRGGVKQANEASTAKADEFVVGESIVVENNTAHNFKVTSQSPAPAKAESVSVASFALTGLPAELNSAKDFRVFYMHALDKRNEGGLNYAKSVLSWCRSLANTSAASSVNISTPLVSVEGETVEAFMRREAARQTIQKACGGFTSVEMSGLSENYLHDQVSNNTDRGLDLIDSAKRAFASSDKNAQRSAMAEAILSRDPLVLDALLERASLASGPPAGQRTYYFQGETIAFQDADAFRAALQLAPCEFGLVCDQRSPQVALACITRGECFDDRAALLQAQLDNADIPKFERYRKEIYAALLNGNASAFLR